MPSVEIFIFSGQRPAVTCPFKPATEKHRQAIEDFLRINEIETLRELPAEASTLPWNEVYKMRVGSLLKRDFKKRRFFMIHALLILLLTFGCLIWNAKDYVNYILEDAGLSSAISERMMDTVFDSLPSDDIEILGQIQDKLQNSPAVDALAEKICPGYGSGNCKRQRI